MTFRKACTRGWRAFSAKRRPLCGIYESSTCHFPSAERAFRPLPLSYLLGRITRARDPFAPPRNGRPVCLLPISRKMKCAVFGIKQRDCSFEDRRNPIDVFASGGRHRLENRKATFALIYANTVRNVVRKIFARLTKNRLKIVPNSPL